MSQLTNLENKVAVVTGSSRGIGKAIAIALAKLGADVVVTARTVEEKDWIPGTIGATAKEIEALGRRTFSIQADLTHREDIETLVTTVGRKFGHCDILINNAACFGKAAYHSSWELSLKSWDLQLALNVTAPFLLSQAFATGMKDRGGGLIMNVTSGAATEAVSGLGYGTSKAALNRMTLGMAHDYRDANIPVIALDPGFTRTEITEIAAAGIGMDAKNAHPVEVPTKAALYLITHDPMSYTGEVVIAEDLVKDRGLL